MTVILMLWSKFISSQGDWTVYSYTSFVFVLSMLVIITIIPWENGWYVDLSHYFYSPGQVNYHDGCVN